jgi:transcriptional regulator with XRE-family HTH domain
MKSLRDIRTDRGLTQRDLAHRAGVNFPWIVKLERGHMPKAWRNLSRLADVLAVSTDAVLGRGEPPAAPVDALAREDRVLLNQMREHAEHLLGSQMLRLNGGWRSIARTMWLGDLFRARDNYLASTDAPMPKPPDGWYKGWESKRQRQLARGTP